MKISPLLPIAVVVLLCSCGGSKPDMSRPALTGVRTPVYEGMVAAMKDTQYAWLNPQTTVYVQSDSIVIGEAGYVKVWWNDSSGYVPAGWLIPNGRMGVLYAIEGETVYTDPDLTIPSDATFGSGILIPVGEVTDKSAQIMYDVEGEPALGYIDRTSVFLDSIDLKFYVEFQRASGSVGSYEAIRNDSRWASSKLRTGIFGDDGGDDESEEVPYWAQKKEHIPPTWFFGERDVPMTDSEIPGDLALNYMWEDSTLSEINHFGDTLGNGYEDCMPDFHKTVAKYILVFTPKDALDFSLEADLVNESGPSPLVREFMNVTPGTKYNLTVSTMGYYNGCNPITFRVRMKNGRTGEGSIGAECGD